jgi:hypothetical protein
MNATNGHFSTLSRVSNGPGDGKEMKRKVSTVWTRLCAISKTFVLIALLSGCSAKSKPSNADLNNTMAFTLTNTLNLDWPNGFSNVQVASYKYSSFGEGSQTTVYIQRINTDNAGASNLMALLRSKNVTVAGHKSVEDRPAKQHADWWQPENYRECRVFQSSRQSTNTFTGLTGIIALTPTNCPIFIQLMIVQH